MKKKILFVIDSLICAGAEKSLVSLLNQLDYDRFEIDLQLFSYGGEFEQFLPEEVNLLTPLMYTRFLNSGCSRRLLSCFNDTKARRMLQAKWTFSYQLRTQKPLNNIKIARLYWESISNNIENNPKEYDFAIAYAQGVPTFYVIDKVKALRKFGWVNVSYHLSGYEKSYQSRFYQMLDGIVTVSDSAYEVFRLVYPEFAHKMRVIRDIVDTDLITKLSVQDNGYNDNFQGVRILTVARLNKHQKGYDIALEACRLLKERGIKFKWYALGRGNYEQEMRTYIANNNLDNDFILLGTTANPYPYFRESTLYVQTSRHEGYGLSIAEARLLNIPVVTTEFDAVYNQMVPGENGLVVPQDPVAVADAIEKMLTDNSLYKHIVTYLQSEKKGNQEEVEKFYSLLEE